MANIKFVSSIWVATAVQAADFYVAPYGNTSTPCAKDQLLATMEVPRVAARETGAGTYRIILMPRNYFLANAFMLDACDSSLTIEATKVIKATLYRLASTCP